MGSRYRLYLPLILLFVVAAAYQARFTEARLRYLLHPEAHVQWPLEMARVNPIISSVSPEVAKAGLHEGDRLLSVNGRPYTGWGVLAQALAEGRPGDAITVTVRHAEREGTRPDETLTLRLWQPSGPRTSGEWLVLVVLNIVMPVFCLLVGFWVVALRPRDPLAWLLLGLLLGFGQFPTLFDPLAWKGWQRDIAIVYHTFFKSALPLWMLLFGVYFPERLNYDRQWPWAKWLLIIPLLVSTLLEVIISVGTVESTATVAPLYQLIQPYQKFQLIVGMLGFGTFFFGIGSKLGTVSTSDARRRLVLMFVGSQVSLTPMFILALISLFRGKDLFDDIPEWIAFPSLLLLFLFPLTLAYVIVVQRALDVRVVVRQGVQYLLARSAARVLQVALSAAIIFAAASLVISSTANRPQKIMIVSLGISLVLVLRRAAEWLRVWTDRRFFREAFNAEQILTELSDRLRTMVETGPLLDTVARRISESLHVPRVALLLKDHGAYRPAHTLGYAGVPAISFPENAGTVEYIRKVNEPVRVYLDDSDSWVYKTLPSEDERLALKALDSQLLLPLAVKEKLLGIISLSTKQSEEPYSGTDLRLLKSVATQAGLALENSQLAEAIAAEVVHRERMNRELEIAREVQQQLFPQNQPPMENLDYLGACRPAAGVGGDYYDFFSIPGNRLGLAIGDVSGKGIPAALLMSSLQASLRGQTIQGTGDLAGLMSSINRLIYQLTTANRYATFFYAQYEPITRNLTYVNAGHNPPVILRKTNGSWEVLRLEIGGTVVGLLPEFPYQQASVTLERGDLLVAFTDGISEALNPEDEEWGEERLIETAKTCDGRSARETLERLMQAADAFVNGAKQHDDMTLVVVRVT